MKFYIFFRSFSICNIFSIQLVSSIYSSSAIFQHINEGNKRAYISYSFLLTWLWFSMLFSRGFSICNIFSTRLVSSNDPSAIFFQLIIEGYYRAYIFIASYQLDLWFYIFFFTSGVFVLGLNCCHRTTLHLQYFQHQIGISDFIICIISANNWR